MTIDLHVHSVFSDGLLTPDALCALAKRKHVTILSLCDHDTVSGLPSMAQAVEQVQQSGYPLSFVPSVELSTGREGRTHVLGYGVHSGNVLLQQQLADLRQKRMERYALMLQAFSNLGIDIPPQLLPDHRIESHSPGRPHLARALIQMGQVNTMDQAFSRYLGEGKPAYVPLEHLTTAHSIAMLRTAGAVPVLAHPIRLGLTLQHIEALVESLVPDGLMGLEAYHPSASNSHAHALETIARRHDLLVTGGSDFHGDRGTRAHLGGLPSGWHAWREDYAAFQHAMQQASTDGH